MKKNQTAFSPPKDTPATRKRRLQARLQELSERSEQELKTLVQSLDKAKSSLIQK